MYIFKNFQLSVIIVKIKKKEKQFYFCLYVYLFVGMYKINWIYIIKQFLLNKKLIIAAA